MKLPDNLQAAIEEEIAHIPLKTLEEVHHDLSTRYRQSNSVNKGPLASSQMHRHAYLTARMPATYAAVYHILQEIHAKTTEFPVYSLLDLGAGPGTVMWAAASFFPNLTHITLVEQDKEFITMGKRIASHAQSQSLHKAQWKQMDLQNMDKMEPADLVVLSYSIGELGEEAAGKVIDRAWELTQGTLV